MSRPQIKRFRLCAHPGYHVRVVVWETLRELEDHYGRHNGAQGKGTGGFFTQCHYGAATRVFDRKRPGTIHVCRERWNTEIVAHECLHAALVLYGATLGGFKVQDIPMEMDEPLCYSIGRLVSDVQKWLWEIAPNEKWSKSECRPSSCNE